MQLQKEILIALPIHKKFFNWSSFQSNITFQSGILENILNPGKEIES